MKTAIAALASGVLLALSLPPTGIGPLAWVALVPAAYVAFTTPGRRGRLVVPLAYVVMLELLLIPALPLGIAEGQWGHPALPILVDGSPLLVVALLLVPVFGALLYLVGFGSPLWLGSGPLATAAGFVLVPALAWTVLDFARVELDPGAWWGPLFLSQVEEPTGTLIAGLGPWLVSGLIVAANYSLALALARRDPRPAAAAAGLAAALAVAVVVEPDRDTPDSLRVAAIQPGYDTAEEDRPELRYFRPGSYETAALDLIADLGALSLEAAERGARLIVWPEAVVWVDPAEDLNVRRALKAHAEASGATLVAPFFLPEERRGGAVAVAPSDDGGPATLSEPSFKHRAMWYLGEEGGGRTGPIEAGGIAAGPMLGVDTGDPGVAAELAGEGAELLVSSTHDWEQLATQQRAFARVAVEVSGLALVRADWRYGSAIYDADGELVAASGDGLRRTVLVADVGLAAR